MTRTSKIPDELPAAEMADVLGITPRQLQALAARGTLPRAARNAYPTRPTAHAYFDHLAAAERARAGSPAADALRDKRQEEIARRMAREDREIISLDDAMETLDEVTAAFLDVVDGMAKRMTRDPRERRRVAPIVGAERDRLAAGFARLREQLRTGRKDPEPEDDDA